MITQRCKMLVRKELEKLGFLFTIVELGVIEVMHDLTSTQLNKLKSRLLEYGLELMDDKKTILVEKIKHTIIEMVQSDIVLKYNFSIYLSEKLNHSYVYLSNLFSTHQGYSIEHFIIKNKIERVKELILYDELNITEISIKMHYSSISHLSKQFKQVTGISPSQFKKLKIKNRKLIETL